MQFIGSIIMLVVLSQCVATDLLLKIGEYASDNKDCALFHKQREDIECDPNSASPVCAVLIKEYISEVNACLFCTHYGNSPALIVELDAPQTRCKPFQIADNAMEDPHCWYFYNREGPKFCTREGNPICAVHDGRVLTGGNKCDFCTKHGNLPAIIKSIGQPCVSSYDH